MGAVDANPRPPHLKPGPLACRFGSQWSAGMTIGEENNPPLPITSVSTPAPVASIRWQVHEQLRGHARRIAVLKYRDGLYIRTGWALTTTLDY